MIRHRSTGQLFVLTLVVLLAACAAGARPTPTPAGSNAASRSPSAVTTPTAAPSLMETKDVVYASAGRLLPAELVDVYAPTKTGSWPVVVMFHGSPDSNSKLDWSSGAREVANLGFVVFVPSWGHFSSGFLGGAPTYDQLQASISEAACAVAFARTHGAEYGGDPSAMVVFGHSGGANIAAMVAFARPAPAAGCLGGTTLGTIDALVTWDGDWMAIDPIWDSAIAADPRLLGLYTPLTYLGAHKDLKVAMLASEDPAPYARDVRDPAAATALFGSRDPSGDLRRQLEANGALADGSFDLRELQGLLFSVLKAQGSQVSLDVLPGATHDRLGGPGLDVLLQAIRRVAAAD